MATMSNPIISANFTDETGRIHTINKYFVRSGFLPSEDKLVISIGMHDEVLISLEDLPYPGRKEQPPFNPMDFDFSKVRGWYENAQQEKFGVVSISIKNEYPIHSNRVIRTETFKLFGGKEISAMFLADLE